MSDHGPMQDVRPFGRWWMATCPSCGTRARMDGEQLRGEVSVDCPECDYHETHDHREVARD